MGKLTKKQRVFVEEYLQCWNASEAARRAGYSERSARVIGRENLTKPDIANEIQRRINEKTMKADEVLCRLAEIARGVPSDCWEIYGALGFLDLEELKTRGLLHLVKKVTYSRGQLASVELYDAQAALVQLGKHHLLFADRVKQENWRDEALDLIRKREVEYKDLADEFGADLATELFTLAGVPIEAKAEGS